MKIALFHNSYQMRGGEDSMFELEQAALRALGHEVVVYHVSNTDTLGSNSLGTKIHTALTAAYNKSSKRAVQAFLDQKRPDISHVHNWFPLLSPSIYTAHQRAKIPVVQTLHNYRLGCAAATYRRRGQECTLCSPGNNRPALKYRCYNNSLPGTITWKHLVDRNWSNGQFTESVDHYICPSQEVQERHYKMGLPVERMSIIPNACPDPLDTHSKDETSQKIDVCFAGRLVPEKGVDILLRAWQQLSAPTRAKARLKIIGDGPELAALKAIAASDSSIHFHGTLTHAITLQHICQSDLLVCPSIWAEPFGLTVIEAMGAGIPVIASRLGGPAKIIAHKETGYLVDPGNSDKLCQKIDDLLTYPNRAYKMGQRGRAIYEANYTPRAHALHLVKRFRSVIKNYQ